MSITGQKNAVAIKVLAEKNYSVRAGQDRPQLKKQKINNISSRDFGRKNQLNTVNEIVLRLLTRQ